MRSTETETDSFARRLLLLACSLARSLDLRESARVARGQRFGDCRLFGEAVPAHGQVSVVVARAAQAHVGGERRARTLAAGVDENSSASVGLGDFFLTLLVDARMSSTK